MRTSKEIQEIFDVIVKEVNTNVGNIKEAQKEVVNNIIKTGVHASNDVIQGIITTLSAVANAVNVNGVKLPKFVTVVNYTNGDEKAISIRVRNSRSADYKYVKVTDMTADENLISDIAYAIFTPLYTMLNIELAKENINEFNALLANLVKEAGVDYEVAFDVEPDNNADVLIITDKKVVFNAGITQAHEVGKIGLFPSEDAVVELIADKNRESIVDGIKLNPTTVKLIKSGLFFISALTDKKSRKRADKIIRGNYSRQAKNLANVKSGLGYFEGTVTVAGEEKQIFAIVEKTEDGKMEVVLKPFDVVTLEAVDFDVLANL